LESTVTLIAVTGYGQRSDIQRSLQAGFDFHLTKPVEAEDIKSLFRRVAVHAGRGSRGRGYRRCGKNGRSANLPAA
jgi:CheY-like chemotaxis protein